MPAAPIGPCWEAGSWEDTAWEADTWGIGEPGPIDPDPVEPSVTGGRRRRLVGAWVARGAR